MSTGFFTPSQFGFRKGHSTKHAILVNSQIIHDAQDNGETVTSIFANTYKAFDTIFHFILKIKLDRYGIRGTENTLITSYLKDRKQHVDGDNVTSSKVLQSNNVGVHQGSILCPLLL